MPTILITFLASFLIWVLIGLLFIIRLPAGRQGLKRKDIIWIILSGLLALGIAVLVKYLVPNVPRPYIFNSNNLLTITTPTDSSFPSEHTALAFGLAFAIYLRNKKLGLAFITGALLVALGRVLANVHFIIDIIGSVILGLFSALLLDSD